MNARISLSLLFAVLATFLLSCGGKSDEPRVEPAPATTAELKYDVSIRSDQEVNVAFIATKGFEPNIYRDGKLVSQGNYSSGEGEPKVRNLRTEFKHNGKAFALSVTLSSESEAPISVELSIKMYVRGVAVHSVTKTLKLQDCSCPEQFMISSDSKYVVGQ